MTVANQVIDRCRSTNDLARELGEKAASHGTWISARVQEAGRGRMGRVWDSREGNLFISWVLRLEDKARWTWVPLTAAVAVALAARELGVELKVKWPNDLWSSEGAKVGGILCEAVGQRHGSFIIAGLGLNCAHAPEGLDQEASSLSALAGRSVTADDVRLFIHEQLIRQIRRLETDGPQIIRAEYDRMAAFPRGTAVTWQAGDQARFGIVEGLGESGELVVRVGEGALTRLYAEDVKIRAAQKASGGSAL